MDLPDQLAPIVLFCYNRPWHLEQTVRSLQANTLAAQSELFIYSDGPKKEADRNTIRQIREYLDRLSGFRKITIIKSEQNQGLASSVIKGVTQVVEQYSKVIVLEDDMLTTPDFLDYMNRALHVFTSRDDIFSITGYTPPFSIPQTYRNDLFLVPRASSWGWGTWAHKWAQADWGMQDFSDPEKTAELRNALIKGGDDLWPMLIKQQRGIIDSWAIRWTLTQAKSHAYGLYPVHSKIKNIGTDGSGTNFTFKSTGYGQELKTGNVNIDPQLKPDESLISQFRKYYNLPVSVKIKNWIKYRI